ncbi:hypothetical protein Tco_0989903 [Tanacetum coccineum]|uniref:MAK10-like protein n=1 Tax=Tanacetum coccineum TaxID=301880 RepID=A0ABQ5EVL8_9ASTR
MGYENPIRTLGDYSRQSHEGYQNTLELPDGNNVVPLRFDTIRRTIDQSTGDNLCDKNAEESWALLEDLALCDNESWNDPRDFAKPFTAISLPQDVPSTSDRRLTELKNQVQHLMEAHLALKTSFQKVISEKLDNTPTRDVSEDSIGQINSVYHDHQGDGAPPNKGIKSSSKLLFLKYQYQSSLGEHNRNSSPKRVHFVNTITIIRKEDKPKEEEIVEPNAIKDNNHNTTVKMEEKVGRELSGSKTVIGEGESSDIKRDNPDDRACGDTKE